MPESESGALPLGDAPKKESTFYQSSRDLSTIILHIKHLDQVVCVALSGTLFIGLVALALDPPHPTPTFCTLSQPDPETVVVRRQFVAAAVAYTSYALRRNDARH